MQPFHRIDLTFPARDERLATVVDQLSDSSDGPHADNFVSNEDSFPRVAATLAKRAHPGGIYLGVGPDQNFTYIAQARPALAFIVDFRRRNLLLHLLHKALFSLAVDRVSYLERLTARHVRRFPLSPTAEDLVDAFSKAPFDRNRLDQTISEVVAVLRPLALIRDEEWSTLATIHARLAGPGIHARFLALRIYPTFARLMTTTGRDGQPSHLFARESFYQVVRSCQLGDRVIPVVGDFSSLSTLPRLGDWLRKRGFSVDVFYTSDVEFFLLRSGKFSPYLANLIQLPWSREAVIVRTSTREIVHSERFAGDSSTTIVRPVARFLKAAKSGEIRTLDDLFAESR